MAAAVNELKDVAEQDVAFALAVVGTGTVAAKALGGLGAFSGIQWSRICESRLSAGDDGFSL